VAAEYPSIPLMSRARVERGENPTPDIAAESRSIESALVRGLSETGLRPVMEQTGISETRLSRFRSGAGDGGGLHLSEVAAVLAAMDLALIDCRPSDLVSVPRAEYDALVTLSRKALG
jgi:hypothetical protein